MPQSQPEAPEGSRGFHENLTLSALIVLAHQPPHRRGARAGRRCRQIVLQQVPGLSCDRRRRQEQGRSGAQRPERPQVGHRAGYSYSDANKNSGITWNEAKFKEYIKDPKAKIPGTKMAFAGIKKDTEINDLWAFISQYDKDGKVKAK